MKDKANQTTLYRYDAVGRLTKACPTIPCGTGPLNFQYGYDANGNMTSKTKGTVQTTYAYNTGNELESGGGVTYSYDANGQLASSSSGYDIDYNVKNQTTSVDPPGAVGPLGMEYGDATQDRRVTLGES